ncbi:MAG: hypothetical protein ACLFPX_01690 [Candidatus Omnitrophota bacterium]
MNLQDLDRILAIPDKEQRYNALRRMAASFGLSKNELTRGGKPLSEEALAVKIYDAWQIDNRKRRRSAVFSGVYIVVGVVVFIFLLRLPGYVVAIYKKSEARREREQRSMEGVDNSGNVVTGTHQQPVKFRPMHGTYEEFYDNGALHYEYVYDNGDLVKKREFHSDGRLSAVITFDDKGNPIYQPF